MSDSSVSAVPFVNWFGRLVLVSWAMFRLLKFFAKAL